MKTQHKKNPHIWKKKVVILKGTLFRQRLGGVVVPADAPLVLQHHVPREVMDVLVGAVGPAAEHARPALAAEEQQVGGGPPRVVGRRQHRTTPSRSRRIELHNF